MKREMKIAIIASLIVLISILHYGTSVHHPFMHVIHREFYLIPIVLAAYWFGVKGGLTVSVISSILFLPWALMSAHVSSTYQINNVLQLLTFNVVAYVIGKYQDARKSQFIVRPRHQEEALSERGRNVLLCVDNSENALKAARYVVDTFTKDGGIGITVFGVIREPSEDLFPNREELNRVKAENESSVSRMVQGAQEILVTGGFPAEAIETKTVRIQKESLAGTIMEEQQRSRYNTIVVGGSRMSKTEEFLFGNVAVKLVRESDCPVLTIY